MEWRDILNPRRAMPGWSFEHSNRLSPRRWAVTYGRAAVPWVFWRRLRLEYPISLRRLAVGVVAIIMLAHLTIVAATLVKVYQECAAAMLAPRPRMVYAPNGTFTIVRAPPASAPSFAQVCEYYADPLLRAAAWPYRTASGTVLVVFGGWIDAAASVWLIALGVFVVGVPPGFLALGETFRRCRVRPAHLARGLAYSLAGPFMAIAGTSAILAVGGPDCGMFLAVAAVVWVCVYWHVFVTRYLRLTHGAWVVLAMLTIAGLCAAIAVVAVWLSAMGGIL